MSVPNKIRQTQTQLAFDDLRERVSKWLTFRRQKDRDNKHFTQLNAIEVLLDRVRRQLEADFQDFNLVSAPGLFYDRCAQFELKVLWLRRIWDYFREKFDQREILDTSSILTVADAIVWSCYSSPFERSNKSRGPAPLPFLEARYSPEAYPADLVPPALKGEVEVAFFREYLNRMPVSVVRLPPLCVKGPWWLIYIGHEVGHHVQYDLLPQKGLVAWFKDGIEKIVHDAKRHDDEVFRWGKWSREIFADAFSVCCMGPWAVRALVEFELKDSQEMLRPRDDYPPALVRLQLLAKIADRLCGSDKGTLVLRGVATELAYPVSTELELIHDVAEFALGPLADLGLNMPDLCDFQRTDFETSVPWWCDRFCERADFLPGANIRNARLLVSAALAAWERIAGERVGDDLETAREALVKQVQDAILRSDPGGTRASQRGFEAIEDVADDMAALLRKLEPSTV
jgi:hypothetical protein